MELHELSIVLGLHVSHNILSHDSEYHYRINIYPNANSRGAKRLPHTPTVNGIYSYTVPNEFLAPIEMGIFEEIYFDIGEFEMFEVLEE